MMSCGQDRVAERLRHLLAVFVDDEAVGDDLLERRPPARAQADEQRALEPAAVLVAALEVEVGRPASARAGTAAPPRGSSPSRTRRRGCRARARTRCRRTPGRPSPSGTNSAIGRSYHASAPCSSKTEAARSTSAGVSSASPHFVQSTAGIGTPHARWREMHQSGRLAIMFDMPLAAPRRQPPTSRSTASSAAGAQRRVGRGQAAPSIADEPLRRRQEDHRVVAAPAVRIRVLERLAVPQPPAFLERLLDLRVRVEHALPAEELDRVEEVAARADRRVDLEAVLHAGLEVVAAVAGRGVHGAGALLRASRSRRARRPSRARTADAGSAGARARRPSSAPPARRSVRPVASRHSSAPAPRRRSPRGRRPRTRA